MRSMAAHGSPTLAAIVISVIAHCAHYTTFWFCASKSIEMSGPRKPTAEQLYSALPIIETVAALPITPGGLGTRENLVRRNAHQRSPISSKASRPPSPCSAISASHSGASSAASSIIFYRPSRRKAHRLIPAMTTEALKGTFVLRVIRHSSFASPPLRHRELRNHRGRPHQHAQFHPRRFLQRARQTPPR